MTIKIELSFLYISDGSPETLLKDWEESKHIKGHIWKYNFSAGFILTTLGIFQCYYALADQQYDIYTDVGQAQKYPTVS